MAHAWVTAGYPHWGWLRQLSGRLGMRLDESKGLLRRTFTFHGTDEQAREAYAEFERRRAEEDGIHPAVQAQKEFMARCERDGPPNLYQGLLR